MNAKIIRKVAEELGETQQVIDWVSREVERFVAETINEGTYKGVMLPYLGKFAVKPKRYQNMNRDGRVTRKITHNVSKEAAIEVEQRLGANGNRTEDYNPDNNTGSLQD